MTYSSVITVEISTTISSKIRIGLFDPIVGSCFSWFVCPDDIFRIIEIKDKYLQTILKSGDKILAVNDVETKTFNPKHFST